MEMEGLPYEYYLKSFSSEDGYLWLTGVVSRDHSDVIMVAEFEGYWRSRDGRHWEDVAQDLESPSNEYFGFGLNIGSDEFIVNTEHRYVMKAVKEK